MIYFLRHIESGLIKIGKTNAYDIRLLMLQKRYGDLEVLGLVEGYTNKEAELHEKFRQYHVLGVLDGVEWFLPANDLIQFIQENAGMERPANMDTPKVAKAVPRFREKRLPKLVSNLPAIIKHYRAEHGLTQAALAELVCLDPTFISRLESDKKATRIELGTVEKLRLVIKHIDFGNLAVEDTDQ